MYKSFLVAGCLLAGACQLQNDSKNNTAVNQVSSAADATAFQSEGAKLLNLYLQIKAHVSIFSDTTQLHLLSKDMMQTADSITSLSNTLPEPIRDSVASASMALSDELSGLQIENDLHEIQMAFQVASLQLFELLKWMKLSGVTLYKFYDVEGILGKGASWLDINRVNSNPYEEKLDKKNWLVMDSICNKQ